MDFKNISNQELHLRLEKLTRTERKITHLILAHIIEVEDRRLYFDLGFESIYSYLTKGLKYSESAAYRRIQAAKLLKSSSAEVATNLVEKLEAGTLHLSQLTQMQKCLQEEKKKGITTGQQEVAKIIQSLENKSTFESEEILAKEFNFSVRTLEVTKPQKDESVRFELTLSKEQYTKLEQAKNLLSHQCPSGAWSEVITALAEKLIRSKLGKENPTSTVTQSNTATEVQNYRPALPVKTRRHLLAKAQHQCEFVSSRTGQKCGSRFQLEIDHRRPLSLGGENTADNLRVLCRAHNQRAWQQSLGQHVSI